MDNSHLPNSSKRRYHSQARLRSAETTRRRILMASRELFASRGYAGTTLEAIAELAEVSPKTVTAVFGSKLAILGSVVNPKAFSPRVQQLIDQLSLTEDPLQRIALVAQITRLAYEPLETELELLRTAPGVAAELARLSGEIGRRRRENQGRLVAYLQQQGLLRSGLSVKEALDILWSLTSFDVYRLLVVECHWPPERYEAWLSGLLAQQLLQSNQNHVDHQGESQDDHE